MNKEIKNYSISIKRDNESFMTFNIKMDSSLTVIDALEEIRLKIDPTLTYRHSCHHGSCGTCACIINKTERLACMCFLKEFQDNQIVIEPLKSFKIISDLVVDISSMVNNMRGTTYIRESEVSKDSKKPNEIFKWSRFENCIECGSCISACPVESNFIGPSPLASIKREISKQLDKKKIEELKTEAFKSNGVDACDNHYRCSKVCPTRVFPARQISDLRKMK